MESETDTGDQTDNRSGNPQTDNDSLMASAHGDNNHWPLSAYNDMEVGVRRVSG